MLTSCDFGVEVNSLLTFQIKVKVLHLVKDYEMPISDVKLSKAVATTSVYYLSK